MIKSKLKYSALALSLKYSVLSTQRYYADEKGLNQFFNDAVNLSDSIQTAMSFVKSFADTQGIDDNFLLTRLQTYSDTVYAIDVYNSAITSGRTGDDSQSATDEKFFAVIKALSDTQSSTDNRLIVMSKGLADSIGQSDAAYRDFIKGLTETVSATEAKLVEFSTIKAEFVSSLDTFSLATSYLRSITDDVVSQSDLFARTVSYSRSPADTVTVIDALSSFYINEAKSDSIATDPFGVDDDPAFLLTKPISGDYSSPGDSAAVTFGLGQVDETITALENYLQVIGYNRGFDETQSNSDNYSQVVSFSRLYEDSQSTSDSFSSYFDYVKSYSDSQSTSDSFSSIASYIRSIDDTITISDTMNYFPEYGRTPSDPVSTDDTLARVVDFYRAYSDSQSNSDLTYLSISKANEETVSNSDSISSIDTEKGLTEVPAADDEFNRIVDFIRANNETQFHDELYASEFITSREESINISDLFESIFYIGRFIYDTQENTDASYYDFIKGLSEIEDVSDFLDRTVDYIRSYSDTQSYSDTFTKYVDYVRSQEETLTASDVFTILEFVKNALIEDTQDTSDATYYGFGSSKSDSFSAADTLERLVDFVRAYEDTATVSDSSAITPSKVFADTYSLSDSLINSIYKYINDSQAQEDSGSLVNSDYLTSYTSYFDNYYVGTVRTF